MPAKWRGTWLTHSAKKARDFAIFRFSKQSQNLFCQNEAPPGASTNSRLPCKILKSLPWTGSSMVEQLTLNQRVGGSSPPRFTNSRGALYF